MIVWINGAFGVGKTTVARTLASRWRGAMLIDPERLGFVLSRFPRRHRGDFQDMPAWRRWTVRCLMLASRWKQRVVVPMTVVNPDYFEEIVGALRLHRDVRHFTLLAPPDIVRERLRARGSRDSSAEAQLNRCTSRLSDPTFAKHVPTAHRTVEQITEEILGELG